VTHGLRTRWRGVTLVVRPLAQRVATNELAHSERALVTAARSPNRRHEIRAGRAAAHDAFRAAGVKNNLAVLRSATGQPQISGLEGWHVSLSHGGALVAAACARFPLGVDVVPLDRLSQVSRVVAGHAGFAVPLDSRSPLAPLLLWSAWEALGKVTGEGVLSETHTQVRPRRSLGGFVARAGARLLRWWALPGHLVCVAVPEK
jgi:4'-phosphopantetheinyl transferase EntD